MAKRVPPAVAEAVIERDQWCQAHAYGWVTKAACGGPGRIHHRRMRSVGGKHTMDNLVLLCRTHHDEVHAECKLAYACGLLIKGA